MLSYYTAYEYGDKITYDKVLEINRDFDIKAPAEQELDMWIHGG